MISPFCIRLSAAIIFLILAILGIKGIFYPVKVFDIQFLPLFERIIIDFSTAALLLFLTLFFLTLLFGRFYCSLFCPLGIMQEAFIIISNKKNKKGYIRNYAFKYFILAIVMGLLAGGSVVLLRYIEPYTYFGQTFTTSFPGVIAFLLILLIVFYKNRFFCTNICPAGAILGLLSKISLNKIYIEKDSCIKCGKCQMNCQAGCINSKEKTVDNEMCVKCLKCLDVCTQNAIKYGKEPKKEIKFNLKRRKIITGTAAIALFGIMYKTGILLKEKISMKYKDVILPPGADSEERIINNCLNCNLCVENCPGKVIVKSNKEFPAVHLDYSKGFCKSDCNLCGEVCPSGAIRRLNQEEKKKLRIAIAAIAENNCTKCGLCKNACPYGAIIKEKGKLPVIDGSKCIGCGACKNVCHFNAINIFAVKQQKTI